MKLNKKLYLLVFLFSFPSLLPAQKNEVIKNASLITHNIAKMLEVLHYESIVYNDSFSAVLYKNSFAGYDPSKMVFLQQDIEDLSEYRLNLDNELKGNTPVFYKELGALYEKRVLESEAIVNKILQDKFNVLNTGSSFNLNRNLADFPLNYHEKEALWKDYLTYQFLNLLTDEPDSLLKLQQPITEEQEEAAKKIIIEIQQRRFKKMKEEFSEEIYLGKFLNSMIHMLDPHSNYLLPIERRNFEEGLGGVYYGIGALLKENAGKVEIGELMIGGPAWRNGEVHAGDVFVEVAQQGEKPKNVEGMNTQEIIQLVRGKKDSKVTITFRGKDGNLKKVNLKREALLLEETFTKRAVIGEKENKMGYIYLPKFYTSFDDENGRSCADDIAADIKELLKENISGLILDLRDNGGGSLYEVIKMTGLFVGEQPVVQVKFKDKKPTIANAEGVKQVYKGKLIVLVNERSASAAEIFAAAMQDYQRGIIMGSASTFGKGTVQRTFKIPGKNFNVVKEDLGTIHITHQKYYRVNGGSTQLKGIIPDIIMPGYYEYMQTKEAFYPNALAWDQISELSLPVYDSAWKEPAILKSALRRDTIRNFSDLQQSIEILTDNNDSYPLQLKEFREQRLVTRAALRQLRNSILTDIGQPVDNVANDKNKLQKSEQFRRDANTAWLSRLKADLYLKEAVAVMNDITAQSIPNEMVLQ